MSLSSSSQSNTDVFTVVGAVDAAVVAAGVAVIADVEDLFDMESVLVSELLLRELFAAAEVLPAPRLRPRPRPLPPRFVVGAAVETSVSMGDFISTSEDSETSAVLFCCCCAELLRVEIPPWPPL